MSLQEAYDALIQRVRTLEEYVVGQRAREDVMMNFLSFQVISSDSVDKLKLLWDDFTKSGFEDNLIKKFNEGNGQIREELSKAYEFNVVGSIKQWDSFVDLAVDVLKKNSKQSK